MTTGIMRMEEAAARSHDAIHACDYPGCEEDGVHRAPRSPVALRSYYWFCLEHVRRYNATWSFFAGMSRPEIEAYLHADLTWHRPTWRFGMSHRLRKAANGAGFKDVFGLFGAGAGSRRNRNGDGHAPANERDALAVMDLAHPVTLADIKARFKQLAKCLHPDVNGGDTRAENRLKRVIEAYRVLLGRPNA
ncbi:MAG: J domain-containing protein [Proteobacteria bacterium]|nr:J domain-containing protein [Pseudomonadota bacterium]